MKMEQCGSFRTSIAVCAIISLVFSATAVAVAVHASSPSLSTTVSTWVAFWSLLSGSWHTIAGKPWVAFIVAPYVAFSNLPLNARLGKPKVQVDPVLYLFCWVFDSRKFGMLGRPNRLYLNLISASDQYWLKFNLKLFGLSVFFSIKPSCRTLVVCTDLDTAFATIVFKLKGYKYQIKSFL